MITQRIKNLELGILPPSNNPAPDGVEERVHDSVEERVEDGNLHQLKKGREEKKREGKCSKGYRRSRAATDTDFFLSGPFGGFKQEAAAIRGHMPRIREADSRVEEELKWSGEFCRRVSVQQERSEIVPKRGRAVQCAVGVRSAATPAE